MPIISNADRTPHTLPGLLHRTLAGSQDNLHSLEIWQQTLQPHAPTPVHYHDCDEVVIVLAGCGTLTLDDQSHPFFPDSTLIIPANQIHQITNSDTETHLIAALSRSPAATFDPDHNPIDLPWNP